MRAKLHECAWIKITKDEYSSFYKFINSHMFFRHTDVQLLIHSFRLIHCFRSIRIFITSSTQFTIFNCQSLFQLIFACVGADQWFQFTPSIQISHFSIMWMMFGSCLNAWMPVTLFNQFNVARNEIYTCCKSCSASVLGYVNLGNCVLDSHIQHMSVNLSGQNGSSRPHAP